MRKEKIRVYLHCRVVQYDEDGENVQFHRLLYRRLYPLHTFGEDTSAIGNDKE